MSLLYIPAIVSFHLLSIEIPSPALIPSSSKADFFSLDEDDAQREPQLSPDDENEFLRQYQSILVMQFLTSALGNGFLPSVVSTISSKFDSKTLILLLSTAISSVFDPVFRSLCDFRHITTKQGLIVACSLMVFLIIFILIISSLSESSSLYHNDAGSSLLIITYVIVGGIIYPFTSTSIFLYFKTNVPTNSIQSAYRWGGVILQLGAIAGSLTGFVLVITKVLT